MAEKMEIIARLLPMNNNDEKTMEPLRPQRRSTRLQFCLQKVEMAPRSCADPPKLELKLLLQLDFPINRRGKAPEEKISVKHGGPCVKMSTTLTFKSNLKHLSDLLELFLKWAML